jgi:hypothetical protein
MIESKVPVHSPPDYDGVRISNIPWQEALAGSLPYGRPCCRWRPNVGFSLIADAMLRCRESPHWARTCLSRYKKDRRELAPRPDATRSHATHAGIGYP